MGQIVEFFFSGIPAEIALGTLVVIAAWIVWAAGYNRE